MNRLRIVALLAALSILATPSFGQSGAWKEYRSEFGRFVIQVPAQPAEVDQQDPVTGLMTHITYVSSPYVGLPVMYMVAYMDYPEPALAGKKDEALIQEKRDRFVQAGQVKLSEDDPRGCGGGHPGRRFAGTNFKGLWSVIVLCFARPRMYQIQINFSIPMPKDISSLFLDSFRLLAGPPPGDPQEVAAYQAVKAALDRDRITKAMEFVQQFPKSSYRDDVYMLLFTSYAAQGQNDKAFDAGKKAIESDPENVDMLCLMGRDLALMFGTPSDPNDENTTRAADYSARGIALLGKQQSPKQSNVAGCHLGAGLVYMYRSKLPEAATEFEQVTQATPNDQDAWFYLAKTYYLLRRMDDAAKAFKSCAELPGSTQAQCSSIYEKLRNRPSP